MKALAEIYTIHSFAQLGIRSRKKRWKKKLEPYNPQREKGKWEARKHKLAETEEELLSTSAKRDCGEKAKRMKIDVD